MHCANFESSLENNNLRNFEQKKPINTQDRERDSVQGVILSPT